MGSLDGQAVLITGASAGIGQAIARKFLGEGADLVVVARRQERLEELANEAKQAGRRCAIVVGDAREEETGKLDILVNNAGVGIYGDLVKTSAEDYDTMMDSNMRSTFLFSRHTVPAMIERGAGIIINIASMAGVMGFAGEAAMVEPLAGRDPE
jgi:3-oxoacyl-[acyl-carrier protein] reductase